MQLFNSLFLCVALVAANGGHDRDDSVIHEAIIVDDRYDVVNNDNRPGPIEPSYPDSPNVIREAIIVDKLHPEPTWCEPTTSWCEPITSWCEPTTVCPPPPCPSSDSISSSSSVCPPAPTSNSVMPISTAAPPAPRQCVRLEVCVPAGSSLNNQQLADALAAHLPAGSSVVINGVDYEVQGGGTVVVVSSTVITSGGRTVTMTPDENGAAAGVAGSTMGVTILMAMMFGLLL